MKKLLTIVAVILAAQLLFAVCPTPEPCPIPFEHDPNQVSYRPIGTITIALGDTLVHDLNSCDPDEDNRGFEYELLNAPDGVFIVESII